MRALPVLPLESIRIAAPCEVPWSGMQGDDRRRHCRACDRTVYDLSALTRAEAEALVGARAAPPCVAFYVRSDGTVLTADCPVGLAAVRRRLAWIAAGLGALLALVAGLVGLRRTDERTPGRTERTWFEPSKPALPPFVRLMGLPALPPRPPLAPYDPTTEPDAPATEPSIE